MTSPTPTGITADRKAATVTITWDDKSTCVYPLSLLRNACLCAECRGGYANMKPEPDDNVFSIPLMDAKNNQLEDIGALGHYASGLYGEMVTAWGSLIGGFCIASEI